MCLFNHTWRKPTINRYTTHVFDTDSVSLLPSIIKVNKDKVMKRFITITSALALFGSVSYAMEEDKMDEMMEAPALSVTLGGSAKIGIKNVDDDSKPDADSIHLVREYKVTFGSSGTTNGGLVFGAGMSIIDEHEGGDDVKAVGGSHVYVGGSDGSWKLQFGGNDPGALLAGGIGLADDRIDRGDADVSLSGSVQGVEYRLTMADPQKSSDDWSVGAKFSAGQIGVGVGMDSEDGLAIGVSTDVSGLSTTIYYAKSEGDDSIGGMTAAIPATYTPADTGLVDANDAAQASSLTYTYQVTPAQGDSDYGDGTEVDRTVVVSYAAGTTTERGALQSITGIETLGDNVPVFDETNGILTIIDNGGTGDDPSDDTTVAVYKLKADAGTGIAAAETTTVVAGKWTGLGAKVAIPAGEGTTFSVGYSRMKKEVTHDIGTGSATSSRIELDFSYDLGGGATFNAGIDKDDGESLMIMTMDGKSSFMTKSSDKTTLEANLSFSF